MSFTFIILLFFSYTPFAFSEIKPLWSVNTIASKALKPKLFHNIAPVLQKDLVIQGDRISGIKAFRKKNGTAVWSYSIKGGVSSSPFLLKDRIYFGGYDGFVYSLKAQTGQLIWKAFIGSEVIGTPLIHKGILYLMLANQKIYALSVNDGRILWLHSGPFSTQKIFLRGDYQPIVLNSYLYAGFYDGSFVALNRKTGRLKWSKKLGKPISQPIQSEGKCVFVPLFKGGLFCLNFSGKTLWKSSGGATKTLIGKSLLYQASHEGTLYSLRKWDGKVKWVFKKKGSPIVPAIYKNTLLYGLYSDGYLYALNKKTGKLQDRFYFGRGLSGPVTVDKKTGEAYFFSVDGYLHKVSISF